MTIYFLIVLLLIYTSGVLVHAKPVAPAVEENSDIKSRSNNIGGDPTISLLSARSPTKGQKYGSARGGSSEAHGLDRKGLASLVVSTAGEWRIDQKLAREQQERTAERAGEENAKSETAGKNALSLLLGGPKEGQSWEDHGKSVDNLEKTVTGPRAARDRYYMRLLKEQQIEKKKGEQIDLLAKKLPVIKQRLNKFFPMSGPSDALKYKLKQAQEMKAHHDSQKVKKGGVYLPPRRGKGGMDGKGGVIDYTRDLVPPTIRRGGKGAKRDAFSEKESGDPKKESSKKQIKQVVKYGKAGGKRGGNRPSHI